MSRGAALELGATLAVLALSAALALGEGSATSWLGLRAALGVWVVLVLPGYSLWRACSRRLAADASPGFVLVMSVGLSYVLVLILDVLLVEGGGNSTLGLGILIGWSALWTVAATLRAAPTLWQLSESPRRTLVCLGLFAFVSLLTVRVGGYAGGEEVIELVSIRKLLESGSLTRDGLLHVPGATPTYVYTPYYMTLALVTKACGGQLIATYVSLRPVFTFLALVTLFELARQISTSDRVAAAVGVLAVLLLAIDPDPSSFPASLYPLLRRGAFAAAVLLPLSLLAAVRACRLGGAAMLLPPFLVLATLMTHATEAAHAILFLGSVPAVALLRGDRALARRAAGVLGGTLALAAGFLVLQRTFAAHVGAYEAARKVPLGETYAALFAQPTGLLGPTTATSYLFETVALVIPWPALGVLLAPWLVRARRPGAAFLVAGLAVPMLAMSLPLSYELLVHFTTLEIWLASGYLTTLGLVLCAWGGLLSLDRLLPWVEARWSSTGAALGATLAAGLALTLAVRVGLALFAAAPWLSAPALVASAALAWKGRLPRLQTPGPRRHSTLALLGLFLLPLLVGSKHFGGQVYMGGQDAGLSQRPSLPRAQVHPDPEDWEASYPRLAALFNPPGDIPWEVVEALRRLPQRRVFLYHSPAIYTIPVLLNQYVAHAGFRLSTDEPYFERYVQDGVHALFNDKPAEVWLSETRRLLLEYDVDYVLLAPADVQQLEGRLAWWRERAGSQLWETQELPAGFRLLHLDRPALGK